MKRSDPPFAGRVFPDLFPPLCASAWGDDRYGLWCEIAVGGVVQRLRWIEPGEFWMGSSEEERVLASVRLKGEQRRWFDDEGPRRLLSLHSGFWLADTACTQALWQAVVGDTPSYFTGDPQLPVEQVSWDDVTASFLPKLQLRLGVSDVVTLPNEVQWEYACRAGTETAYYFGAQIHSDQVNFNGNHPLPGGREGEYRRKTVTVKTLPANAWGLYQMHGNVWEWCADEGDGSASGRLYPYRGGAWNNGAEFARSAVRMANGSLLAESNIGFRFALRSIEPGAGGGMLAGAEAGGAR